MQRAGYRTISALNCEQALSVLDEVLPDLIILDWMLPGRSGLGFASALRKAEATQMLPILMLSARASESDKVEGLTQGKVDDYLTKPFSPRELVARIQALLRRSQPKSKREVTQVMSPCGACLELYFEQQKVLANAQAVTLTQREFSLLNWLVAHPNRIFSRQQLLDQIWGYGSIIEERTVDVLVQRLRKQLALHNADDFIETVRGVGYIFVTAVGQ